MCAGQYMTVVGLVSGLRATGAFLPICNKVSLKHKCLTFLALFAKSQKTRATTPTWPQLELVFEKVESKNAKTTEEEKGRNDINKKGKKSRRK